MQTKKDLFQNIPSVDELLKADGLQIVLTSSPHSVAVDCIRDYLSEVRGKIAKLSEAEAETFAFDMESMINTIAERIQLANRNHLIRVINATGVVLHTNLGRSLLPKAVEQSLVEISTHYSNLEMQVIEGKRGSRYSHVDQLLCKLTGAEAAMVVNNNAAAVMLILSTMAKGKEAVVSRGQLVEIGGSFRVPDVMEQSGATLREIGTTNKTHLSDYENAINENTAVLMKVHTSNYKVLGFTESVSSEDMVALGKKAGLPVIEDLGSGILMDLTEYGLPYEPTVQSCVKAGMDVVSFSGDKMLGGPQAGIIVGKKEYIDQMKKNPLTRAFRIDKMSLAALEATLKLYLDPERAKREIPVLRMLTYTSELLEQKARDLCAMLQAAMGKYVLIQAEEEYSEVGGGSMPGYYMPSHVVTVRCKKDMSLDALDRALRLYEYPIITRVAKDRIVLDVRTIMEEEFEIVVGAFVFAWERAGGQK